MEVKSLFQLQKEKNSKIVIDGTLSEYKVWARKNLELHTKISYLANETKCYKYWVSDDSPINKSTLFERYLDCFTHILNIGIDRNYDSIKKITLKPNDYCLSDQFLNLFIDLNDIIISPSEDHYITLLEDFISLGITLGYSKSKIKESFIKCDGKAS